jgi:hypothetical protein
MCVCVLHSRCLRHPKSGEHNIHHDAICHVCRGGDFFHPFLFHFILLRVTRDGKSISLLLLPFVVAEVLEKITPEICSLSSIVVVALLARLCASNCISAINNSVCDAHRYLTIIEMEN